VDEGGEDVQFRLVLLSRMNSAVAHVDYDIPIWRSESIPVYEHFHSIEGLAQAYRPQARQLA